MSVLQASRKEPQRRAELLGPGRGGDRSERRWRRGRSCSDGAAADGRTELLRAELRTPARGAAGAADAGEGDPEAGRRRLRERGREQRELEMCRAAATPTRSLTHSSSYPNGPAKGGPNTLAGPNSPSPELVVRLV